MTIVSTVICKAPSGLDFNKLLYLIENNARNHILRRQPKFLPSLFLYSSNRQTVTIYHLDSIDHFAQNVTGSFSHIIKENPHSYYVIVFQGWGADISLDGYQFGDISKLPTKKKEQTDPEVEYFVTAGGNLKQEYNNGILDAYVESDKLSLLGSSQRENIKNTYNLVKDANSGQTRLEEV